MTPTPVLSHRPVKIAVYASTAVALQQEINSSVNVSPSENLLGRIIAFYPGQQVFHTPLSGFKM